MGHDRALYAAFASIHGRCDDGPWLPQDEPPFVVKPPTGAVRAVLVGTKPRVISGWIFPEGLPPGVHWVGAWGPLSVAEVAAVRSLEAPVMFVGDLKPRDLATYLSLRVGGLDRDGSEAPPLAVDWLGIDDPWLALCQREMVSKRAQRPTPAEGGQGPMGEFCFTENEGFSWIATEIEASPVEMEGLRVLEGAWVDWDATVGPRCMAMLRAGWTLHQEGASNPAFYPEGFAAGLAAALRARMPA